MFRLSLSLWTCALGLIWLWAAPVPFLRPEPDFTRLPVEDCPRYRWIDPTPDPRSSQNCGNCHATIYDEWHAGAHARSSNGRRFLNLVEGNDWHGRPQVGWNLAAERPFGVDVCASCHDPTAFDQPNHGFDFHPRRRAKAEGMLTGIHCDFCHKVVGLGDGEIGLTHGRFLLDLLRPDPTREPRQVIFGPIPDPTRADNRFSPFYRESRYCAACHEGVVFGVHAYSTYSEWRESPAAAAGVSCQQCHMRPTGAMTNMAPGHGGRERDPLTLANHAFFDRGHQHMLRECLKLRMDVSPGLVHVTISTQGVGHRVPTGLPDRHLILTFDALDAEGTTIPNVNGPRLPDTAADLANRPGHLFAKQLRDFDGNQPVPFWRAAPSFDDTRLRPAESETFRFHVPDSTHSVQISLIYRRFWKRLADEKGWPDNEWVVHTRRMVVAEP